MSNDVYKELNAEYNGLNKNKNIWYIGLNNQTQYFIDARNAILSEISKNDDVVLQEFVEYLSVMQEA